MKKTKIRQIGWGNRAGEEIEVLARDEIVKLIEG